MHIVLLGMTGSGKTTVASMLSERLNVPRVSSGDIARSLAQEDPCFVHVDASEWSVIERLTSRRRDDDTPDAIERRMTDFRQNVAPVLTALGGGGVLHATEPGWEPGTIVDYIEGIVS
jgi:adenylate kinase family enzyme